MRGAPLPPPGPARASSSTFQASRTGGHIDTVFLQNRQRHDLKGSLVGRRQDDVGSEPIPVGSQPVPRRHTPAVTWHQAREAVLRLGRAQVVANASLVRQELRRNHCADGMATPILGSRRTAPVSIETRDRISPARLQRTTQDVAITHPCSLPHQARRRRDSRQVGRIPRTGSRLTLWARLSSWYRNKRTQSIEDTPDARVVRAWGRPRPDRASSSAASRRTTTSRPPQRQ